MRVRLPQILLGLSLFLALLALGACGSEEEPVGGGGTEPPPPEDVDLSIRFRVTQTGDTERLLWKGTAEGPDADSPQRTARPLIPAAEPFRVEWELVDASVSILGFQFRATQDEREGDLRLPRDENDDPVWGDVRSFEYENSTPLEFIDTRCPSGGDCPEILLFNADTAHTLFVYAATADGQETTEAQALLEFEIANAAPETQMVMDANYPYRTISGSPPSSLAPGDTIPAGATVVFKLTGEDPDPVVLKMPLPRVRFQARYRMQERSGPDREIYTFYSTPSEADTVAFQVGPFSYMFFGRAVDRLRTVDPTPVIFTFDAGFAPSMEVILPQAQDEIVLRDPDEEPWPQNTVDYGTPLRGELRYWDGRRFYDVSLPGTEEWIGTVFQIPVSMIGVQDPREPSAEGFGNARAFAYEWFGENDPDNTLSEGGGFDDLERFSDANFANELRLFEEGAIQIFVPDLFWLGASNFDPATCVSVPGLDFCGVGDLLRRQLGQITLRARARHTADNQEFLYWSNVVENDGVHLGLLVDEWGLLSEVLSTSFPFHLGLDDDAGGVEYWPARD